MEKPLITTDVASIPEVVSGNVKFVSPGNVEEIVKAVKEIISPDCHTAFAMTGDKIFSWDETVEKIEKLY